MSTFRKYLRSSGQTLKSFAERIGKSASYLSEIDSGDKVPSLVTARDISVATGGIISVTYWLDRKDEDADPEGDHSSHIATKKTNSTSQEKQHDS